MRKSIPVAFFSLMSTLLIFGTVVMGGSEPVSYTHLSASFSSKSKLRAGLPLSR